MPRVFLSYSHDSLVHSERVLKLADRLRRDGVDAWIDQYDSTPSEDWPRWMERQIEQADRVLAICTKTYRRRFDGDVPIGGLGARWEGAILRGEIYRRRPELVIPVVFESADLVHLPKAVRDFTHHVLDGEAGYDELYRHLIGQPATPPPPLGEVKRRSFHGETVAENENLALPAYRAWAKKRFRYVELLGLGRGEMRLDLDEIYVPLRLASPAHSLEHRFGVKHQASMVGKGSEKFGVEALLQQVPERHILVLGEPGSGKTTALCKLHKIAFEAWTEPELDAAILPVFVRLRTLGADDFERDLATYLDRELVAASGARLPVGVGQALVQHGRLLLLFDGLDEVAEEAERVKAMRFLLWKLRDLKSARAVFSCRYGGWTRELEKLELRNVAGLDVCPFDDDQIAKLVESWHREAARKLPHYAVEDALEAAARLNETLLHDREYANQQVKVLVSTPLLLTLLCVVVMRGGEIPRRRADFYEECARVLLSSWRQQTGQRAPEEPEAMGRALEALAFFLHLNTRKEDLETFEALLELKKKLGWPPSQARPVFDWLWREAGLLARFSDRHFGFPHLGLQEHLTARYLAANPGALNKIDDDFRESWWREVFLLLSSLPERSAFGPLSRFLLERGALENAQGLFRDCLRAARRLDLEPLHEALLEPDRARQRSILNLLAGHIESPVLDLVEDFVHSGVAIGPEVQAQAEVLLRARTEPASLRHGVFLAHPADAEPAVLEKLKQGLDRSGLEVLNPPGWPSWRDCDAMAERAAAVLLPIGDGAVDPDARQLAELYDVPVWVLRLPGESGAPVPESLTDLDALEIESFDPSALRQLEAEMQALVQEALAPLPAIGSGSGQRGGNLRSGEAGVALGALAALSDTVPLVDEPFVEAVIGASFLPVPAARFQMGGTEYDDEQPVHWVQLSGFWLAGTPVTNRQYGLFLAATDYLPPPYWRDRRFSDPQQPVVGVSWHDAVAYCEWLSEASGSGLIFQLPSEAQWEYAARGSDGREFPWGPKQPDDQRADFRYRAAEGPARVGSFAKGEGPFRHLDLAGGVWEWCRDLWEKNYERWARVEPLDPVGAVDRHFRPLRGGSWWNAASSLRSAVRSRNGPGIHLDSVGFRVSCVPRSP